MAKDLGRTARASRVFQTLSFAKRVQVQRAQLRETAVTRLERGTNLNFGRAMSGASYSTGRNPSTDRYRSPVS
jgi:hypothetical protein